MDAQDLAKQVKRKNVIDMAVGFTKMPRVFSPGATKLIKKHLEEFLGRLEEIDSNEDVEKMQDDFHDWCRENITASKGSKPPSYGQTAKLLDVILKVYVYYCGLPNPTKAEKLVPVLNCGVDTEIYKHLLRLIKKPASGAALKRIGRGEYNAAQGLIRLDIEQSFNNEIFPVQYDDIMWRELNR